MFTYQRLLKYKNEKIILDNLLLVVDALGTEDGIKMYHGCGEPPGWTTPVPIK